MRENVVLTLELQNTSETKVGPDVLNPGIGCVHCHVPATCAPDLTAVDEVVGGGGVIIVWVAAQGGREGAAQAPVPLVQAAFVALVPLK